MQLFWIPRVQLSPTAREAPQQSAELAPAHGSSHAALPTQESRHAGPAARVESAPSPDADTALPSAPSGLTTHWEARTVEAFVRQLPDDSGQASSDVGAFSGGREAIRLPGDNERRIEGIVVHQEVSLDQRVQGALAMVGLGRIDPCPDIRRHIRSAMEADDPDEVQYWANREQRCR